MTWTKLPAEFLTDVRLLNLPRGARLLWVEGLVWANSAGTDGHVGAHLLNRLTDEPDAREAARQLCEAGLWEMTSDGWRIPGFLDSQLSAEEVAARRAQATERQRRWRWHLMGKHDLCPPSRPCRRVTTPSIDEVSVLTDPTAPSGAREDQVREGAGDPGVLPTPVAAPRSREERINDALAILQDPDAFPLSKKAAQRDLDALGYRGDAA